MSLTEVPGQRLTNRPERGPVTRSSVAKTNAFETKASFKPVSKCCGSQSHAPLPSKT